MGENTSQNWTKHTSTRNNHTDEAGHVLEQVLGGDLGKDNHGDGIKAWQKLSERLDDEQS